jgi:hypothetical protein
MGNRTTRGKTVSWRKLVTVGTASVISIVLVGILVARIVDKHDVTRQVAVYSGVVSTLGLLASAGKVIYDVWDKERDRKKKDEEKKERVKVAVVLDIEHLPGFTFNVDVYNDGPQPIAIKRVAYIITVDGENHENILVSKTAPQPKIFDGITVYERDLDPRPVIDYKQHKTFYLSVNRWVLDAERLDKVPADQFNIVVDSFATEELARISGDEIKKVIMDYRRRTHLPLPPPALANPPPPPTPSPPAAG